jgi:hypothetical protein
MKKKKILNGQIKKWNVQMKRNMGKKNNNLNYRRFELIFRNKRTSI